MPKKKKKSPQQISALDSLINKSMMWIGSTGSIVLHTVFFVTIFVLVLLGLSLDTVLLVLTTAVSLEAIYLAIFIQRSVNLQQVAIASEFDELEEAISDDIDETEKALRLDLDDTEAEISKDIDETERGIVKQTPQILEKPFDEVVSELRLVIREEVKKALAEDR